MERDKALEAAKKELASLRENDSKNDSAIAEARKRCEAAEAKLADAEAKEKEIAKKLATGEVRERELARKLGSSEHRVKDLLEEKAKLSEALVASQQKNKVLDLGYSAGMAIILLA
jgi:predicted  nucleic acid-binding Zn-ribbon protein